MTEPCSKWTHLLQVLQPLQLQLGLQENKKAQECDMLVFVMNRKRAKIELQCFSVSFKLVASGCRKDAVKGEDVK